MTRRGTDASLAARWLPLSGRVRPDAVDVDAFYMTYWSLNNPLCLSQSLPVVRALTAAGHRMGLVTFEQEPWSLDPAALASTLTSLRSEGILWIPLRYHKRPRLLGTLFDILYGGWVCSRTGSRLGVRLFHGRGTVAAALAHVAARLSCARFFNDADGPLSDEYADAGVWQSGSVEHRLTRRVEQHLLQVADAVAVLTTHRRNEVKALVSREVTVLPCGVDTDHFQFREDDRRAHRLALGLTGRVLVFAGSVSGWYLTEAMLDFASTAVKVLGGGSLLVLTNDDPTRFTSGAAARGMRCVVRKAMRGEMPGLLSAGDAGLSLRLSTPSAAAASPVKNGEYLACGLPVVTTPGIGDYTDLVQRRTVGVVVRRLDATGYREASDALAGLLEDPGLRSRCHEAAVAEVSLAGLVLPRYRRLYDSLLDPDTAATD
jgi:glycosyltransferase involved in cell wall biosynthesis